MGYNVLDLAKYIITICVENKYFITLNKLQFLLYLLQVSYLRAFNKPLFEENIYVNRYAFHIEEVYKMFYSFGSGDLSTEYPESKNKVDESIKNLINNLLEKYGSSFLYKGNLINKSSIFNKFSSLENIDNSLITTKDIINLETIEI